MAVLIGIIFLIWLVIFVNKPRSSALIYALFLFPPAIIVFSWPIEFYVKRWVALALLLFVISKHGFKLFKTFPLKSVLLLMFLESWILILLDGRFDVLHRVLYPIMDALDVYLPLFLGFSFALLTGIKMDKLLKPITICCIIVELYGLFNLITDFNPIRDLIGILYDMDLSVIEDSGRDIITSIYRYSFDYGFNSALFLLLFVYYFLTQKSSFKPIHFFAIILSLLGVFLCGSRSVLVSIVAAFFIYFLFIKSKKIKVVTFLSGTVIMVLLYLFVPSVNNMINLTMQTITGSSVDITNSSSTDMRSEQFASSLYYMDRNPILGNGFKYIFIDLDWANRTQEAGMAGYESILFVLMIERGLLGLATYLLFFVGLIIYFLKYCLKRITEAILGLSITVLFILFACFTGALDAWLNTMVLCGILISRIVEIKKSSVVV